MSGKGMTLLELKMRAKAKEDDDRAKAARKRNILVLILDYFSKSGYVDSMDRLSSESSVSLSKWQAADNVDLNSVLQEFESFYEMKGAPLPPLPAGMGSTPSALPAAYRSSHSSVDGYQGNSLDASTGMTNSGGGSIEQQSVGGIDRKGSSSGSAASALRDRKGAHSAKGSKADKFAAAAAAAAAIEPPQSSMTVRVPPKSERKEKSARDKSSAAVAGGSSLEFGVQGNGSASIAAQSNASSSPPTPGHTKSASMIIPSKHRPSPSPVRSDTPDSEVGDGKDHSSYYETRILKPMPEYADSQFRELAHIITRDIYSENPNVRWNDIAELEEAKQLLKEAVVMPLKFPQFFTGLLSPWKGVLLYGPPGTGKTMLARAVATECRTTFFNISASSIVSKFRGDSEKLVRVLFELARYHAPSTIFIDEIDSIMGRRDAAGEHEGSRRMKTELLIQMDGLSKSDDLVFVLAASNLPWDLDIALLRRLEKRILVPLPNERARLTMIKGHLTDGERASGLDYALLARKTEGYSGSDIALLCKEAAMRPVRRLMQILLTVESDTDAQVSSEVKLDPVVPNDVSQALACTRPSAQSKFLARYTEWHAEYGAGMRDVSLDSQSEE